MCEVNPLKAEDEQSLLHKPCNYQISFVWQICGTLHADHGQFMNLLELLPRRSRFNNLFAETN